MCYQQEGANNMFSCSEESERKRLMNINIPPWFDGSKSPLGLYYELRKKNITYHLQHKW